MKTAQVEQFNPPAPAAALLVTAPSPLASASLTAASMLVSRPFRWLIGLAALLLLVGCGEEAEIVQYDFDPRPPAELRDEKRMLGAIIPLADRVWFIKLQADVVQVDAVDDQLQQWVSELQFIDKEPVFNLPEGWQQRPGGTMRFATLEIPAEPLPLEVSVSFLSKAEDWNEQVAMNVNRWRGQLGLEPVETEFAGAKVLDDVSANPEEPAIWVDITGEPSAAPSMDPSMLGGAAPPTGGPAAGGPPAAAAPAATGERLSYDAPSDWQPARVSSMRLAAFQMGPEDRKAEITVIPAGGDVRGNVERWIGQIRSQAVDPAEVDTVISAAQKLVVDGRESQRFIIQGDGEPAQSIDGTVVPLDEGFHLFIKATGDSQTISQQSASIEQFLNSLKINL